MIDSALSLMRLSGEIGSSPLWSELVWEVLTSGIGAFGSEVTGYLIRATFLRPDRDTGKIERGAGRWWFVERGCTEDAAVKTMWLALRQIVEHEAMEAFTVTGNRPFDPHVTVWRLIAKGAAE